MRAESRRGFTLIELVVTLSAVAVILAFGVPGFQAMIRDARLSTVSSRLLAALNLARSEAIKRGQQVTLCKANLAVTPPACDTTACNAIYGRGCWERGWMMFADANGNGIPNDGTDPKFCANRDCILRIFEALPGQLTLRTGSNISRWIAFRPPGTGIGSNGLVTDTFRLCQGKDTVHARSIVINSLGRARLDYGAPSCP